MNLFPHINLPPTGTILENEPEEYSKMRKYLRDTDPETCARLMLYMTKKYYSQENSSGDHLQMRWYRETSFDTPGGYEKFEHLASLWNEILTQSEHDSQEGLEVQTHLVLQGNTLYIERVIGTELEVLHTWELGDLDALDYLSLSPEDIFDCMKVYVLS